MSSQSFARTYQDVVFGMVRIFFLIGCGAFLLFAVAAAADLLFHIGWGYPWQTIPGGIIAAAGSYGGSVFVNFIHRAMTQVFK